MKYFSLAAKSAVVIGVTVLAALQVQRLKTSKLEAQIDQLEQEKTELRDFAERLAAQRRVARVDVLEQFLDPSLQTVNVLRWQELDEGGPVGPPLNAVALGNQIYFEGLVLKFEHDYVGQGDLQKGISLVMFRRIFGDQQAPESVPELDRYAIPSAGHSDFQTRLWKRFWDFIDSPALAAEYGIRVAQIEAPAVPVKAGQIWEISIDASGGLNLKKLADAPPIAGRFAP